MTPLRRDPTRSQRDSAGSPGLWEARGCLRVGARHLGTSKAMLWELREEGSSPSGRPAWSRPALRLECRVCQGLQGFLEPRQGPGAQQPGHLTWSPVVHHEIDDFRNLEDRPPDHHPCPHSREMPSFRHLRELAFFPERFEVL